MTISGVGLPRPPEGPWQSRVVEERLSRLMCGLCADWESRKTVIESVEFDEDENQMVASVRPVARRRGRCGRCLRRCRGYGPDKERVAARLVELCPDWPAIGVPREGREWALATLASG